MYAIRAHFLKTLLIVSQLNLRCGTCKWRKLTLVLQETSGYQLQSHVLSPLPLANL